MMEISKSAQEEERGGPLENSVPTSNSSAIRPFGDGAVVFPVGSWLLSSALPSLGSSSLEEGVRVSSRYLKGVSLGSSGGCLAPLWPLLLILRILFLLAATAVVMEGMRVCRSQGAI